MVSTSFLMLFLLVHHLVGTSLNSTSHGKLNAPENDAPNEVLSDIQERLRRQFLSKSQIGGRNQWIRGAYGCTYFKPGEAGTKPMTTSSGVSNTRLKRSLLRKKSEKLTKQDPQKEPGQLPLYGEVNECIERNNNMFTYVSQTCRFTMKIVCLPIERPPNPICSILETTEGVDLRTEFSNSTHLVGYITPLTQMEFTIRCLDEDQTLLCERTGYAGYKPLDVTDFDCRVRDWTDLECWYNTQENPAQKPEDVYKICYYAVGHSTDCIYMDAEYCNNNDRSCWCERNVTDCWRWSSYAEYMEKTLHFVIYSENALGNAMYHRQINNYDKVIPGPVENLRVTEISSDDVTISYDVNREYALFEPGLKIRVRLRMTSTGSVTSRTITSRIFYTKSIQNLTTKGSQNVTTKSSQNVTVKGSQNVTRKGSQNVTAKGSQNVTAKGSQNVTTKGSQNVTISIPYPHTEYDLIVDLKSATEGAEYWSDPSEIRIVSRSSVPEARPAVNKGAFYEVSTESGSKVPSVRVYWSPVPKHHQNGPSFHYLVRVFDQTDTKVIDIKTEFTSTFLTGLNSTETYRIVIRCANSVGVSQSESEILLPGDDVTVNPPVLPVALLFNEVLPYYWLRWYPVNNFTGSNYTVHFCKPNPVVESLSDPCEGPLYHIPFGGRTNVTFELSGGEGKEENGGWHYIFAVSEETESLSWSLCHETHLPTTEDVSATVLTTVSERRIFSVVVDIAPNCHQRASMVVDMELRVCLVDKQICNDWVQVPHWVSTHEIHHLESSSNYSLYRRIWFADGSYVTDDAIYFTTLAEDVPWWTIALASFLSVSVVILTVTCFLSTVRLVTKFKKDSTHPINEPDLSTNLYSSQNQQKSHGHHRQQSLEHRSLKNHHNYVSFEPEKELLVQNSTPYAAIAIPYEDDETSNDETADDVKNGYPDINFEETKPTIEVLPNYVTIENKDGDFKKDEHIPIRSDTLNTQPYVSTKFGTDHFDKSKIKDSVNVDSPDGAHYVCVSNRILQQGSGHPGIYSSNQEIKSFLQKSQTSTTRGYVSAFSPFVKSEEKPIKIYSTQKKESSYIPNYVLRGGNTLDHRLGTGLPNQSINVNITNDFNSNGYVPNSINVSTVSKPNIKFIDTSFSLSNFDSELSKSNYTLSDLHHNLEELDFDEIIGDEVKLDNLAANSNPISSGYVSCDKANELKTKRHNNIPPIRIRHKTTSQDDVAVHTGYVRCHLSSVDSGYTSVPLSPTSAPNSLRSSERYSDTFLQHEVSETNDNEVSIEMGEMIPLNA